MSEKNPPNIVEAVRAFVELTGSGGGNLKGKCPFHDDTVMSFQVSPSKNLWHCFGCQAGGDVAEFLRRIKTAVPAEPGPPAKAERDYRLLAHRRIPAPDPPVARLLSSTFAGSVSHALPTPSHRVTHTTSQYFGIVEVTAPAVEGDPYAWMRDVRGIPALAGLEQGGRARRERSPSDALDADRGRPPL